MRGPLVRRPARRRSGGRGSARRDAARAVTCVLALAAVASCGGEEASPATSAVPVATTATPAPGPDVPSSTDVSSTDVSSTGPADAVVPEGFATIGARITATDGSVCEVCLWLAEHPDDRARGLMGVTDLGGLAGMAFRYDEPRTTNFTMRNTVLPLSIAFFGGEGQYLDEFDMEPCRAEPCPAYPTPPGFLVAIEVPAGDLPDVGIGPGSVLELLERGCGPG